MKLQFLIESKPSRVVPQVRSERGCFVGMAIATFDLIETMRFEALDGFIDLDSHLERMKASADELGFGFNRHDCRNDLQAATFRLSENARVRLVLSPSGALAIEVRAMPAPPVEPVAVGLAPLPFAPDDLRLRHKTSDRAQFQLAHEIAGKFEVVFVGEDGFVTEGSFTNVFVERGGVLLTPPRGSLMPGILRGRLIAQGEAIEADLTPDDLVDGFFIGNSLRGLIAAQLIV